MGREEADRAIKDQEIGTFLFRWSKSEVGCYSLTVKNADEIKHFRIGHSLSSPFTLGFLFLFIFYLFFILFILLFIFI